MYKTEQEKFWAGDFGDDYSVRNDEKTYLSSNIHFFSKVLDKTVGVKNVLELGANIGLNIRALQTLRNDMEFIGVEINKSACEVLKNIKNTTVFEGSIFDFETSTKVDLSYIKGVLIHINPDLLDEVYEKLYSTSQKYVLVAEYYNPSPVSIPYRGHSDRLFKRDFAGEMLDKYKDLKLIDYGFLYHRDNNFPQDDISWFLMEKIPLSE